MSDPTTQQDFHRANQARMFLADLSSQMSDLGRAQAEAGSSNSEAKDRAYALIGHQFQGGIFSSICAQAYLGAAMEHLASRIPLEWVDGSTDGKTQQVNAAHVGLDALIPTRVDALVGKVSQQFLFALAKRSPFPSTSLDRDTRRRGVASLIRVIATTQGQRDAMEIALASTTPPGKHFDSAALYEPAPLSDTDPRRLLNRNHAPNDRVADAVIEVQECIRGERSNDHPLPRLAGAGPARTLQPLSEVGSIHSLFCDHHMIGAFDHPDWLKRYPQGVFDGQLLLMPSTALAASFGQESALKSMIDRMKASIDDALNPSADPARPGVARVPIGSLRSELLAMGNLSASAMFKDPMLNRADQADISHADLAHAHWLNFCHEAALLPQSASRQVPTEFAAPTPRALDDQLCDAAFQGNAKRCGILIAEGANPKARGAEHGLTPLLMAALGGDFDCARFLLPLSDSSATDAHGQTPADLIERSYHSNKTSREQFVSWLRAHARAMAEMAEISPAAPASPASSKPLPRL